MHETNIYSSYRSIETQQRQPLQILILFLPELPPTNMSNLDIIVKIGSFSLDSPFPEYLIL